VRFLDHDRAGRPGFCDNGERGPPPPGDIARDVRFQSSAVLNTTITFLIYKKQFCGVGSPS